jgi:SOS-response transcriptional repressor LexA
MTTNCPKCGQPVKAKRRGLTPRQRDTLLCILDLMEVGSGAPTYESIARAMKVSSLATVSEHIEQLVRKRWVDRMSGQHRAIIPLVDRWEVPHARGHA